MRGAAEFRTQYVSALRERRLTAQASVALLRFNAHYWLTGAPRVHLELARWKRHADLIPNPTLRALALNKLSVEGFNAEVAATLSVITPHRHRANTVVAIVALEVLYDYLDGLTERSTPDPLGDRTTLFHALADAVAPGGTRPTTYYSQHPLIDDGGYLHELVGAVQNAVAQLPATGAVADVMQLAATRCSQAQVRIHAGPSDFEDSAEQWARLASVSTALEWREFLAGSAASVLAMHALIAAAADHRTTHQDAVNIDEVYLSICALSTMLDSIVDYHEDLKTGEAQFIERYETPALLAQQMARIARHTTYRARDLPHGAHHLVTLVGVVAYYASTQAARSEFARPITAPLLEELRPLITPTLGILRTWRAVKAIRKHMGRKSKVESSEPHQAVDA